MTVLKQLATNRDVNCVVFVVEFSTYMKMAIVVVGMDRPRKVSSRNYQN